MMTPEHPDNHPASPRDWDDYLANRLSEYGKQLRDGASPENSQEQAPDCPPEVLSELKELESCLIELKQACDAPPIEKKFPSSRLEAQARSTLFLDGDSSEFPAGSSDDSDADEQNYSDLRLGRFEVGEKLGEGTYGIVYHAFDPQLKRHVALKVPRLEAAFRGDLRERFLIEGESAARLNHRNIVTVYEAASDGFVSLIASEYVSGPSLAAWMSARTAKIPPTHAAGLVAPLADALWHAHTAGVLHRDIKPSNILLAPVSPDVTIESELDQFQPKLTDFGLAKLLETQDMSVSGAIIGTPAYMPPEQIAGKTGEVGPQADIYALGMVLYELLAGKNPFASPSISQTIHNVTQADLPRLSRLKPDVPRDLETICLKCLHQEKNDRYATSKELAEDLRRFLDGVPILARNISPLERAAKWCRRYPALSATTLASFTLLLALLGVSVRNWLDASRGIQEKTTFIEALEQKNYFLDISNALKSRETSNTSQIIKNLQRYIPSADGRDFRTFPWWFLWREVTESSKAIFKYPVDEVEIAVNADQTLMATGGKDCVIHLWSLPEKKIVGELRGHTDGPIEWLDFYKGTDPEGKPRHWLLSTSGDGTARIWDVETQTENLRVKHVQDWLPTAVFLGNNAEFFATGGDDGRICIWNSTTGEKVRELLAQESKTRSLCRIPGDELLLASDTNSTLRFWNWRTGELDQRIPGGLIQHPIHQWSGALRVSPDRTTLAVGSTGAKVYLYGLQPENFGKLLAEHDFRWGVRTLGWKQNGALVIGMDREVLISNNPLSPNCSWETLRGHEGIVWSLASLEKTGEVVSADKLGMIRLWSADVVGGDFDLPPRELPIAPLQWNGNRLGLAYQDKYCLLEPGTRTPLSCPLTGPISSATWHSPLSTDEGFVIVEGPNEQGVLRCYQFPDNDPRTRREGNILWSLPVEKTSFRNGSCSPDGKQVAVSCGNNVWIVDLRTGTKLHQLEHPSDIRDVEYSPAGDRIYTTSGNGQLTVWTCRNWSRERTIDLHSNEPSRCVALSLDGKLVATCGQDSIARILKTDDFSEIASFDLSSNRVVDLALLDGGGTLLSVDDRGVSLWSVPEESEIYTIGNQPGIPITRAASNGKVLAIFETFGHLRLHRGKE